jgi:hypothetical protein
MRGSWTVLVAAALAVSSFGCGTVANLKSGHPEPYGGVQRDVAFLAGPSPFSFEKRDFEKDNGDAIFAAVIMGFWGAEFCASGVADTLTLPFIARRAEEKEREDKKNAELGDYAHLPVQYAAGAVVDP